MLDMYNSYFNFSHSPFESNPDQRFLFLSESHKEVLAALLYFVRERKGFALVCGDVGTGKTMLINCFLERLPNSVTPIMISNPGSEFLEILTYIAEKLGISHSGKGSLQLIDDVKRSLLESRQHDRRFILVIDEAHLLSDRSLEHIRLLSNIETPEEKLLQILLIGQHELSPKLARPEMRQLRQRININRFLAPLGPSETIQYIDHRLKIVGSSFTSCFERGCEKLIFNMTEGVPRRINILCDSALLVCQAEQKKMVDRQVLKKADKAVRTDLIFTPKLPAGNGLPFPWKPARALLLTGACLALLMMAVSLGYKGILGHEAANVIHGTYPLKVPPLESQPPPTTSEPETVEQKITLGTPQEPEPGMRPEPEPEKEPPHEGPVEAPSLSPVLPGQEDVQAGNAPLEIPENHVFSAAPSEPHATDAAPAPNEILQGSAEAQQNEAKSAEAIPNPPLGNVTETVEATPGGPSGVILSQSARMSRPEEPVSTQPPCRHVVVKKGDILAEIASRWYPGNTMLGIEAILKANPSILNIHRIYVGQILSIPLLSLSELSEEDVRIRDHLYYAHYGRYDSLESLQNVMIWLTRNKSKYLMLSTSNINSGVSLRIMLGGHESDRELGKAMGNMRIE